MMASAGCSSSTVDTRSICAATPCRYQSSTANATTTLPASVHFMIEMNDGRKDVLGQVYCMEVIASARNPQFKDVRRAVTSGSATPSGLLVAEGFHLLEEALRSGCEIEAVLVSEH